MTLENSTDKNISDSSITIWFKIHQSATHRVDILSWSQQINHMCTTTV